MENILIVEDDKDIRGLLGIYMRGEGFNVIEVADGKSALDVIDEKIDLIMLDIMLPDINGLELCRKIRERFKCPVIMVTAKTSDQDKIVGLTYGADDYIVKPFNPLEVVARVKSQMRRYKEYSGGDSSDNEVYYKGLVVNLKSRNVSINGKDINLTKTEFELLKILLLNKGEVMSGERLFKLINNDEYYSKSTNTVAVHMRNLREKMGDSFESPEYIKTVWGVGYIIEK